MSRVLCPFIFAAALGALISPTTVEHWVQVGGPLVIFALLFACGLGLPMPEDIPLVIGGFFAAKGQMHLTMVCVLAWLGIIGGDCVLYHLGKRYGLNVTRIRFVGKHFTKERILKAEKLFERYGIWVVAIGRLFAGIRGAMVVAAGAIRFNFVKFVIADAMAALVSGGLFIALGYYLGKKLGSVSEVRHRIEPYQTWVVLGIGLLVLVGIGWLWWRHKRHKRIVDAVMDEALEKGPGGAAR